MPFRLLTDMLFVKRRSHRLPVSEIGEGSEFLLLNCSLFERGMSLQGRDRSQKLIKGSSAHIMHTAHKWSLSHSQLSPEDGGDTSCG